MDWPDPDYLPATAIAGRGAPDGGEAWPSREACGVSAEAKGLVRAEAALAWLNFFLADVRGGLGPYLSVFLLTHAHWNQALIGLVMTVGGIVGLLAQTPVGALIDAIRAKRAAIVVCVGVLAASAVAIALGPVFPVVITTNALMAVAGATLGPAVAAITLGIVPGAALGRQFGRNATFDHAGNVFIAFVAGAAGWWLGQRAVFLLIPFFAALSAAAVLAIPSRAIDHARARGLDGDVPGQARPAGLGVLLECRLLLVFAACLALFHLANAAMLPLVGQKLALANRGGETALMSACIIAAQAVMLPMAMLVAVKADRWGRKPLLLAAFLVLPLRGALYTLSDDTVWLVAVQLLDGVGAGLVGALTPLVIADLMQGTGRYNVSQGAVATVQGLGASLSNGMAGLIVVHAGYSAAFLTLAAIAAVALLLLAASMSETRPSASAVGPSTARASRVAPRRASVQRSGPW